MFVRGEQAHPIRAQQLRLMGEQADAAPPGAGSNPPFGHAQRIAPAAQERRREQQREIGRQQQEEEADHGQCDWASRGERDCAADQGADEEQDGEHQHEWNLHVVEASACATPCLVGIGKGRRRRRPCAERGYAVDECAIFRGAAPPAELA